MKRISICSLCVILIVMFVLGCSAQNGANSIEPHLDEGDLDSVATPIVGTIKEEEYLGKNCKLIIRGRNITHDCYVYMHFEERYVELPLITILETLGAKATFEKVDVIRFEYDSKVYILNTKSNTFSENGKYFNWIALPPGTSHGTCFEMINGEYMLDSSSIRYLLAQFGLKITVDYNQATVFIENNYS